MRQTCIFSGSSHPKLVDTICERLGQKPANVELKKFANGETSVEMKTSVRDQDVFIVQSGSSEVNDNVMEMLIMISACKGGSARSITAVMPYFPYSRQSKKKQHRGAITARMIANLMNVAGVNHVITIDLHASQMQGFFKCPVDNLVAEPLLAKWIRMNIHEWWEAVVVSKNPGGTKRVTSLADALKLSFGIVTTERRRPNLMNSMYNSVVFESMGTDGANDRVIDDEDADAKIYTGEPQPYAKPRSESQPQAQAEAKSQSEPQPHSEGQPPIEHDFAPGTTNEPRQGMDRREFTSSRPGKGPRATTAIDPRIRSRMTNGAGDPRSSPRQHESPPESRDSHESSRPGSIKDLHKIQTAAGLTNARVDDDDGYEEPANDQFNDERARDVVTGRLIHGHIVDDDAPSPTISAMSASMHGGHGQRHSSEEDIPDTMLNSFMSTASSRAPRNGHGLGGTGDATASDEEEEEALKDPEVENTITLVGNVRDKPVFIVDDMIDKAGSWIAAAETVVKRGGATKVICMATHGLFGGDCLQELEMCDEIDCVVVTNAFPIPAEKKHGIKKLVELDVSGLLSEAIRRNHYGESISQLYQHYE